MATVNKDFRVKNNISLTNTADTITAATHYFVETGSDGVIRPKTLANARTEIVTTAAVNAAAATTVGTITSGTWQGSVISATYIDTAIARLASPTFTGTVILPTSATGGASIRIPHGTAPTSPTNGDIWTTTSGLFARINGSTQQYATTSGNLSQFAATTSAQLAGVISDETGSGALVFATSPTLTTPNIGAASGTSLSATGNISGSTLTSTVATGTAPLTVTSTTAVTNFNADYLDGRHGTDFAYNGIIAGSSNFNSQIISGTYRFNNLNTNGPGFDWGQVLIMRGSDTISQLAIDFSTATIKVRAGNPTEVGGGGAWTAWRTVWADHNDGAGSGLDADLLDGQQGSYYAPIASPTFTGTVILPTSATTGASIRIPHGTAPSAPTNGDIWTTTAGVYARINGSTVGPFGSASQEVYYQTTAPASPTTGTIWIDSDETTSFLNTNDFALKASPTFTGTVAAPIINASGLITANAGIAAESWTKDDITTRTQSGFIQTSTATTGEGWPETTNSWYHLISSTHSNTSNYYSLQLSAPFYSNKLYFRSTNGVGTASWSEVATVTYVNQNSGGLNPFLLGGM